MWLKPSSTDRDGWYRPSEEARKEVKMLFSNLTKRYLKLILIIALLVGIVLTGTGCEVLEQFAPAPPPAEEPTEVETLPTPAIAAEDRAILEVYEHLLSQADSYQAKAYLADFYTIGDNWSAEAELLKDGTSLWYVTVDTTNIEFWEEKPYWQQASWLILDDGTVIPSNQFQANALRIEADLQELSLQPEPPETES